MKRIFDIFFSFVALVLFSPLGLIIIFILKLTGEGEIFYKQNRIGKNGNSFGIYKFVTMIKNSPRLGAGDITLKNDPRVLPFGKILRKLKLNEFPQFINVLLGDMSLVGPRPLVKNQYEMISESLRTEIKKIQPGITGIGSIIFRDEEKFLNNEKNSNDYYQVEIVPFKAKLENWYASNRTFLIDLLIIFITIISVVFPNSPTHNFFFPTLPRHSKFNP